ncbi:hypothetical protein Oweho_1619 [Owenweeksia hongkongensis DSM 17368]|uniref:Outer membrane protein beta-barrel domain-containing protein n=1 Tax=Owenweeksia hongkongensis (strain DSM 17368 / CIP 108786 / JCM 12287 / NRRL B-23963 / UST20020801) TaxID=926562 RepID=G8QZW8_OWEHD|nr:hypothetical protein [Owenweeksia hongkongensis]AEV32608.1 hypothetical protein Oweho_1619 [Owenweeksia hongkongensis DSM 17368]
MANSWKKITDKVDSAPLSGPQASDWEAMNAKIQAHPSIANPKGGIGLWFKTGLGVLLLAVLGFGYLMYSSSEDGQNNSSDNSVQVESPIIEPVSNSGDAAKGSSISEKPESQDEVVEVSNIEPKKQTADISANNQESVEVISAIQSENGDEAKIISTRLETEGSDNNIEKAEEISTKEVVASDAKTLDESLVVENPADEAKEVAAAEGQSILSVEEEVKVKTETENTEVSSSSESEADENEFQNEELVLTSQNEVNENEPDKFIVDDNLEEATIDEEPAEKIEKSLEEVSEELDDEEELSEDNSQDLVQSDYEESSTPAESINLRSAGFSLNGLNVGAGYSTDFSGNLYGTGVGVDVDIQRGGLLLNTGIHYYQMNTLSEFINYSSQTNYNTTHNTVWDTTITTVKDSAWVIDSAYSGHWADKSYTTTTVSSSTDTILDSTVTKIETTENRRVKLSYIEMPIMAGHRFRFNRLAVDIFGGVVLNQLTTGTVEGADIQKKFGMDAVIQPAIRFYLKPEWSVFGRAGLRYGLVANEYRPQQLYCNFQIGLTYHW